MSSDNYMEYEGQRFQTSKPYSDWDDFKEDPKNYLESETEKMQAAVKSVQFLPTAADREGVMAQMSDKQFPGFGCAQLGILHKDQLDQCAAFSIQIPRSSQCRYVGYVNVDGRFVLVSDFIGPPVPSIAYISVSDDHLNFHNIKKSLVHRDPIAGQDGAEP
ncbi:hypothetical protein [Novipirellula caenicola]|uniref:Uncharacterized protein n=1 Tax=Novipirellula caenicola TaxID=1536901 RepID=A0ABP9W5H7_9BACT